MSSTATIEPPASGEVGEPDVFVSYSRADQEIVLRMAAALEQAGFRVWVDAEDIPASAKWGEELAQGIREAHTLVFVISPDSVRSTYCEEELAQAVELGKRLVPVLVRDADGVPKELADRQYVFLREQDDFSASLGELTSALTTDLEWVREHRHWLLAALRWDASGRDRSLLLRGRDLKAAEAWLARQAERSEPRPTRSQTELLLESRLWETRRLRIIVVAVVGALAVAIVLGVLALLQRNAAKRSAAIAASRELAIASASQRALDPQRALLLAIEAVKRRPTAEADNALRNAVLANRLRVEVPTRDQSVTSLISDVAFSPGGRAVAAALGDGTVRVADLTGGKPEHATTLPVPKPSADDPCSAFARAQGGTRIAVSPDGRFVATAGNLGWIAVWRWHSAEQPVTSPFCLGQASPTPEAIADAALLGGGRGVAMLGLAFAPDGSIEALQADGRLLVWRWDEPGKPVVTGLGSGTVRAAAFAPGGKRVAVAEGTQIRVWSAGRSAPVTLAAQRAYAVALSADGRHVAAAAGGSILVWQAGASTKPRRLAAHAVIRSLAISPDGRFVASGDHTGTIRVWAVDRTEAPTVLSGSNEPVTALAFSGDGTSVLSGGDDGALRVWDWDPGRSLAPAGLQAARWPPVVTHDGSLVAVAAEQGQGWISSGGRVQPFDGAGDPGAVSLSADGSRAAAPAGTRGLRVWELPSSPRPRTIPAVRRVYATAVSPDGRWIASAEDDRFRLLPWPATASVVLAPARPFARETRAFVAAAFSSDSGRVAGAAYNGKASTIAVWTVPGSTDAGLPKSLGRELEFHAPGYVSALDFSPDGTQLLAAVSDGSVRVWKLRGGSVTVLRGHRGIVADAAFSADGREIVSGGSADGTLRLWELDEGGKAVAFPARVGTIGAVGFSADGSIVASGTTDARVWRCDFCGPIGDVLARARNATARSLTPDERALYLHER